MPDAQSSCFYIVHQLQVAGRVSTKVSGNHLLLSVTRRSERCRSGSEIPGAGLYERQGAERRSRGVEGCGIRDELIAEAVEALVYKTSLSGFESHRCSISLCQTSTSDLRRSSLSGVLRDTSTCTTIVFGRVRLKRLNGLLSSMFARKRDADIVVPP